MTTDVVIRRAGPADVADLRRLALLDGACPLRGDVLVAFADGEARAALSLTDGRVVANPFRRTLELVELLGMRAKQLDAGHARRPRVRLLPAPRPTA
jgi:hypothetical protein